MSSKNRPKRSTSTPKQDPNTNIQRIALVVIVLVIAAIIWAVVKSQRDQAGDPSNAQTSPAEVKQYGSAPEMQIDPAKEYTATVKMAKGGEFVIELYPEKAPIAVNNFVFLARDGYYDGVTFHRVLDGFMAQGGDPTGTGRGGPGYAFVNEDSDLRFDKPGVLAMANAGRDTNGSQFFITFAPQPRLDGGYTIFGQVISGMDVVNNISRRDPEVFPTQPGDAIESITIQEQ